MRIKLNIQRFGATKSVQSDAYQGRYLKLTVTEESISVENNTSTIRWTIESIGGSSSYYTIYNCSVVLNGQTVANYGTKTWDSYQFPAKKGSESGTITIYHKTDGTADPVYFTLNGKVYNSGTESHTDTLPLTTIPRHFTQKPKVETQDTTTTSGTFKWTTSENAGEVKYTVDGGSEVSVFSGQATTGTFTVSNFESNTSHTITIDAQRKDSGLWSLSDPNNFATSSKTVRIKLNNEWKDATPYVRVNGEWKVSTPFIRDNGQWKRGK